MVSWIPGPPPGGATDTAPSPLFGTQSKTGEAGFSVDYPPLQKHSQTLSENACNGASFLLLNTLIIVFGRYVRSTQKRLDSENGYARHRALPAQLLLHLEDLYLHLHLHLVDHGTA